MLQNRKYDTNDRGISQICIFHSRSFREAPGYTRASCRGYSQRGRSSYFRGTRGRPARCFRMTPNSSRRDRAYHNISFSQISQRGRKKIIAHLFSSPPSLRHPRACLHAYRVHPAHRYRPEPTSYPSSRAQAAPLHRASHVQAPPSPSAPVRAAPPVDAHLPRDAASLPERVPPPRAALRPVSRKRLKKSAREETGRERESAYRLGAHPSLVEYEPLDLLGFG
jgi:hypothetical protein